MRPVPAYDKTQKWVDLSDEWMRKGACAPLMTDPGPDDRPEVIERYTDQFFADDQRGMQAKMDVADAKGRCLLYCPVRDECLSYAVAAEIEHGVWGGLTGVERLPLIQQRRRLNRQAG